MSEDLYDRFVGYLQAFAVGAEHAQTAVTICAALALEPNENSRRQLRACAEQASRCGVLVCSGQRGYYVPRAMREVDATADGLASQAEELALRAKRMRALARRHFATRPPMFAMLEAEA